MGPDQNDPPTSDLRLSSKRDNSLAWLSMFALFIVAFFVLLLYLRKREKDRQAQSAQHRSLLPIREQYSLSFQNSISRLRIKSRPDKHSWSALNSSVITVPPATLSRRQSRLRYYGTQRFSTISVSTQHLDALGNSRESSPQYEDGIFRPMSPSDAPRHIPWPK